MSHANFVHLRNHSAYSLAEGALKIPDLVGLAAENEMPAVAITDSGNLFGSVLGAIVGSNIGGEDDETTREVGAVVGTAVGSVVGQNVGESLSRKAGVEIIIKLDTNEREISIVQEMPEDVDYSFRAGDKVRIVRSGGKARVVPYN